MATEALRPASDQEEIARLQIELEQAWRREAAVHAREQQTLEQQTATAEVLRAIASTPTDLPQVLQIVAETAMRLCEADDAIVFRVEQREFFAILRVGPMPRLPAVTRMPLDRRNVPARAAIERRPIHVPDIEAALDDFPVSAAIARDHGWRSALAMPLIRDARSIGVIFIWRDRVRPFTDQQIALLETFADQAVIAIENARLFEELERRNAE